MKVTILPLVAALGLVAQVSAGPIRIYVLTPEGTAVSQPEAAASPPIDHPVAHLRWGLAAAGAPQPVTQPWTKVVGETNRTDDVIDARPVQKHSCMKMKMKAIAFSNWLREKVGLEPIAPPPPHLHFPHGRPLPHRPEKVHGAAKIILAPSFYGSADPEGEGKAIDGHPPFHHFDHHHDHAHAHHHHRPSTFAGRLQRALMTLGPWEGRIVAFVIGCGIGSLLRMIYVLSVVAYRSFASRKEDEKIEVIFSEIEEVPPPTYIPDQKVAVVDDKSSA